MTPRTARSHAAVRPAALARALFACFLAAPVLGIPDAHAVPTGRLSWDDCDPVVTNKNWSGPGTYVIVISARGLTTQTSAIGLSIDTGATADAWEFADEYSGFHCQPPSRLAISSTGTACEAAPVLEFFYARQIWITQPHRGGFVLEAYFDTGFATDPDVRYTVARLAFDHSHSVVGEAAPGSGDCGQVEVPVCFAANSPHYLIGRTEFPLPLDSEYLTWQDFNASHPDRPCPAAVPAQAKTWGQIKSQYR
jgi:hypothetical protein